MGGDKRLNLNQPLLSVRRASSTSTVPEVDTRKANNNTRALPCFKSELNSGPIRNPGLVPFLWEQIPGRPKDDSQTEEENRGADIDKSEGDNTTEKNNSFDSEDSNYLDALDAISRSDSFLNCSLSGLSGATNNKSLSSHQDIMMGRFLPAAQAVASDKPHFASRKPTPQQSVVMEEQRYAKKNVNKEKCSRRNHSLPESVLSSYYHQDDEVEEAEDDEDLSRSEDISSAKLCGLLPRFCLLNPLLGLSRDPAPVVPVSSSVQKFQKKKLANYVGARIKSDNKAIADAIYERRRLILHQRSKQRFGNMASGNLKTEPKKQLLPLEIGSLKLDESSKQLICCGGADGVQPYRSLSRRSSSLMQNDKGFLGIPEQAKNNSWPVKRTSTTRNARFRELLMHQGNIIDYEPSSPAITDRSSGVKTLYIDSAAAQMTADCQESNSSSSNSRSGTDSRGRNPSIDYSLQRMMSDMISSSVVDDKPSPNCEMKEAQEFQKESLASPPLKGSLNLEDGGTVQGIGVLRLTEGDCKVEEEERINHDVRLILAPLPEPKSPSESWLSRALPSSGSLIRHAHSRSLLGVGNLGFRGLSYDSQLKM